MPHELKGREIFAVGTWNGMDFTEADLDDIIANFEALKEKHRVPLKFGHNTEQPITDGQPAIGWIERVYKQGQKLYADFTHLPRTVYEAIKNKLYRTVSVELLFNVNNQDGKRYNHVLDAVALLGADHPAVNSLADLDTLMATRTRFTGGHRLAFETIAGNATKLEYVVEDDPMADEKTFSKQEIKDLIDAAVTPLKEANDQLQKDLKTAHDQLAEFNRQKEEDERRVAKEKVEHSRKAVKEVLDAAVTAKTLTPAAREIFERQIGVGDDDRVVDIKIDEIKQMFSVEGKQMQQQQGFSRDDDAVDTDNPEEQLLTLTRKTMAQSGETDFHVAFMRTAQANPELHKAYLDENGVK